METPFFVPNLATVIETIPADGIVSRTLYKAGALRAVIFGMGAGEELSEHTTPYRAVLFVIKGTLRIEVSGETFETNAGSWLVIPPNAPHSLLAQEESLFLLLMVDDGQVDRNVSFSS